MGIFRLNDLSEEERKKYLQSIDTELNNNLAQRDILNQKANEDFNRNFNEQYSSSNLPMLQNSQIPSLYDSIKNNQINENYNNSLANSAQNYNNSKGYNSVWQTILGIGNNVLSSLKGNAYNIANYAREETLNLPGSTGNYFNELKQRNNLSAYVKNTGSATGFNENDTTDYGKKNMEESIANNEKSIQEETNKMPNDATRFLAGTVAPFVGQMIPLTLTSLIPGGQIPTAELMYLNSAGDKLYTDEQKGISSNKALNDARLNGVHGAIEGAILGKIGDSTADTFGKALVNTAKGAGIMGAVSALDPITEEATSQLTTGQSDWNNIGKKMLESGLSGAATYAILGGVKLGFDKCTGVYNKINNGETVTAEELSQAQKEAIKSAQEGLGVSKNATTDEIENAYKTQVKQIRNLDQTSQEYSDQIQKINIWKDALESKGNTSITDTTNNNLINNQNKTPISDEYKNTIENNTNNIEPKYEDVMGIPSTNTSGEGFSDITRPENEGKIRGHYKTGLESNNTTAEQKSAIKSLITEDTYEPVSNVEQLAKADKTISEKGAYDTLVNIESKVENTKTPLSAEDVATGERLFQYYSKIGDDEKMIRAVKATTDAGTRAGETLQAYTLLNHLTPQGYEMWLDRSVNKMNKELIKQRGENTEQFHLTDDMRKIILNSKNKEEMFQNVSKVYEQLGQQVTKNTEQKLDTWRYFSMLANPKTHNRNILGNVTMGLQQKTKNKVAGAMEDMLGNQLQERHYTLKSASQEVKNYAEKDLNNIEVQQALNLNENKYNPQSRLQNNMRTFKSDFLEKSLGKTFKLNDKAMEFEDNIFVKPAYKDALAGYMTANKLTPDTITPVQLNKARKFAIDEANKATFHQENWLATWINSIGNSNIGGRTFKKAVAPFVKTPINVVNTSLEYNPVSFIKTFSTDAIKLHEGKITANTFIDNFAKGLTGTAISTLGYTLAAMGILKASGSQNQKAETYDEAQGNQPYSIKLGNNTYTVDWLTPTAIPLFVGSEFYNITHDNTKTSEEKSSKSSLIQKIGKSISNLSSAGATALNPVAEMTMISGLINALSSYQQDSTSKLEQIGLNAGQSLINQFVPATLGQIARTVDNKERTTISTETNPFMKTIDQTKNQVMLKIPGLRQKLPIRTDIWGNEQNSTSNIWQRTFEDNIAPYTRKQVSNDPVDKAINDLYNSTGDNSVLPSTIAKTLNIDKQKYRFTDQEYAQYEKQYGQTAHDIITNIVNSSGFNKMTDEQKTKMIQDAYSYARINNKINYAKDNNLNQDETTLYKAVQDIKSKGGQPSDYFLYLGKTLGMDKDSEKIDELHSMKLSNNTKTAIYESTIGKDDNLYNIMKNTNININDYLDYKEHKFESDKEDDGTEKGKAINGSSKIKFYNYINSSNMNYDQRLLLTATQYKLQADERKKVFDYIDNLNVRDEEKIKILSKLKGFTVYKNGNIEY